MENEGRREFLKKVIKTSVAITLGAGLASCAKE
jgi:hypothetical protein